MKPLLLLFILLTGTTLAAQIKSCKARVRANRHKIIVMQEPQRLNYSLGLSESKTIEVQYAKDSDRVNLYEHGYPTVSFQIKGVEVISTHYIDYHKNGRIRTIDSIGAGPGGHTKNYIFLFSSHHIWLSRSYYPNGQLATRTRYRPDGGSAFLDEWYSNGSPKSTTAYSHQHTVLKTMRWDSSGVLRQLLADSIELLYYPNGVLQSRSTTRWPHTTVHYSEAGIMRELAYDTLIGKALCMHKKTYSANGILQSLEYYSNAGPCLNWSFYTPEGILKQRIDKGPVLMNANPPEEAHQFDPPEYPFIQVEQQPEFPGGYAKFRGYMHNGLADVLCRCDVALKSSFQLRIRIESSGRVTCSGSYGALPGNLSSLLHALIEQMPQWNPGKRQGIKTNEEFLLEFEVKNSHELSNP